VSEAHRSWRLVSAILLGSSLSWPAQGESGTPCSGPHVVLAVPAGQRERWLPLQANLNEHLRTLRDLDRCAQLTLRSDGHKMLLEVRAGDGRVASRPVASEAQVLRASEALLTLPPKASSPEKVSPSISPLEEPPKPATGPSARTSAGIELGGGASARLAGLPLFIAGGVGSFADVTIDPWLLGISARWDITTGLLTEPTLMDYYLISSAVGVHVGRRFELQSAMVDLLLGPNLVLETQHADDGNRDIEGSVADVRLDFGIRLSGPRRSKWRAFANVDLEVSPARLVKDHFAHPRLPALPAIGLGAAVGIAWSGK
jgi:hypothetical protein